MFLALFLVTVEFVLGNLKLASCLNVARQKCPGKILVVNVYSRCIGLKYT